MDDIPSFSNLADEIASPPATRLRSPGESLWDLPRTAETELPTTEMASVRQSFATWKAALSALVTALKAYAQEAGESGPYLLGSRWTTAVREITAVEDTLMLEPLGEPDAPPAGLLASLMATGDSYEAALLRLEDAATTILDPNVRHAVLVGMSRTFSDRIKSFLRAVNVAKNETRAGRRAVLEAATVAGAMLAASLSVAAVSGAYGGDPAVGQRDRGGIATELYVSALLCLRGRSPGGTAALLLESAKDTALGGSADTRAAAEVDTKTLTKYHPCQAMGYVPVYAWRTSARETVAPPSSPVFSQALQSFDLSFPQSRLAVAYDLKPLVDRRRALEFGPIAASTSGLNYRLVDRLRTIRATPVAPAASLRREGQPRPVVVEGLIVITTDGGVTSREFGPPSTVRDKAGGTPAQSHEALGEWAPFAGAQPRVARYAEASAAVILGQLRAEREAGWSGEMHAQYEAAINNESLPSGETSAEILVNALAIEFERAYDTTPPADAREFRDLAIPEAPGPSDYISAAVARVTGDALSARLRSVLAQPLRPERQGSVAQVPYSVVEREGRISQAILTLDIARSLWRRIKEAFWADAEAFEFPPVKRKETLLRHFRRIAAAAMATAPVYCAPPSLKLWAATR